MKGEENLCWPRLFPHTLIIYDRSVDIIHCQVSLCFHLINSEKCSERLRWVARFADNDQRTGKIIKFRGKSDNPADENSCSNLCATQKCEKYVNSMESHVEHQKHSWITKTWRERKMLKIQSIFEIFTFRRSQSTDSDECRCQGEWNGTKVSWTVKIVLKLIQIAIAQFTLDQSVSSLARWGVRKKVMCKFHVVLAMCDSFYVSKSLTQCQRPPQSSQ